MVITLIVETLSMQNSNRAIYLDAVPERRTKRCSPRFLPGDRFCELRFRNLSQCCEGEKCRPLDQIRQILVIYLIQLITGINFYIITQSFSYFLHMVQSCLCKVHICQLRKRCCRDSHFKVQGHFSSHKRHLHLQNVKAK